MTAGCRASRHCDKQTLLFNIYRSNHDPKFLPILKHFLVPTAFTHYPRLCTHYPRPTTVRETRLLNIPIKLIEVHFFASVTIWVTPPVPISPDHLLQYAAFLARTLQPTSVTSYLNIIGILHKELGLANPLLNNWPLKSFLTGLKRAKGRPPAQKAAHDTDYFSTTTKSAQPIS